MVRSERLLRLPASAVVLLLLRAAAPAAGRRLEAREAEELASLILDMDPVESFASIDGATAVGASGSSVTAGSFADAPQGLRTDGIDDIFLFQADGDEILSALPVREEDTKLPSMTCHTGTGMVGYERILDLTSRIPGVKNPREFVSQYNNAEMTCAVSSLSDRSIRAVEDVDDIKIFILSDWVKVQRGSLVGAILDGDDGDSDDDSDSSAARMDYLTRFSLVLSPNVALALSDAAASGSGGDGGNEEFDTSNPQFQAAWDGILSTIASNRVFSSSCRGLLDMLRVESVSPTGGGVHFVIDGEAPQREATNFADFARCTDLLITSATKDPSVASIGRIPLEGVDNFFARRIVQGGADSMPPSQPFTDVGLTGKGQCVAFSDTGLDTSHCLFDDTVVAGDGGAATVAGRTSETPKVLSYEISPTGDGISRFRCHGTHVAGSIAGNFVNAAGTGVAPEAKLAVLDMESSRGFSVPSTDVVMNTGKAHNCKIHSASWGCNGVRYTSCNGYTSRSQEVDMHLYNDQDRVYVTSAGNAGLDLGKDTPNSVGSPATSKNCIAVGATMGFSEGMGPNYIADFSSRGPCRSGLPKPDVLATGFSVHSAASQSGCGLRSSAGTSMSAPLVAGAAALVRQYFMDGYYPTGAPDPDKSFVPSGAAIKAVILISGEEMSAIDNSRRLDGGYTRTTAYDNHQGFGRVNLIKSLPLKGKNNFAARLVDRRVMSYNSTTHDYSFTIDTSQGCDARQFSAILVWYDPPTHMAHCTKCVQNDLGLTAQKDDGRVIHPNGLTEPEGNNNSERIRMNVNNGENVLVQVHPHNLATEQQKYSLLVTGCFDALDSCDHSDKSKASGKSAASAVSRQGTITTLRGGGSGSTKSSKGKKCPKSAR